MTEVLQSRSGCGRLGRACGALRQHPAYTVGALIALLGLGAGAYAVSRTLWAPDPLDEAAAALGRYDFVAAQTQVTAYLADHPDAARAHFLAARTARYQGDFAGAADHLRRARQFGHPEAAVELEHLLLRAHQHHEPAVLTRLEARANEGGPDEIAILEVLVQDHIDGYRLREAVATLDRLLRLQPANRKALVARGRVKERVFDFGAAVADYRAALDHDADDDEVRGRLAAVLLINGKPDEAASELERLHERQGDTPSVLLGLARCRRQQGQLPAALALLDQLLAGAPDNATALTERGKVALELGRADEAALSLRRAVVLAPYNREAQHSLYQCLRITGPPAEAAAALARYRQLDGDLRRLDKVTSAAIANPRDLASRCAAAELFFRLGEPAEGVRLLGSVLALDAANAQAHRLLARHYRAAGQPERAAEHERRAATR